MRRARFRPEKKEPFAAALTQRKIQFVFVTGYGRQGLPEKFAHAPMLTTPFTQEQLLQMGRTLFQRPAMGSTHDRARTTDRLKDAICRHRCLAAGLPTVSGAFASGSLSTTRRQTPDIIQDGQRCEQIDTARQHDGGRQGAEAESHRFRQSADAARMSRTRSPVSF
jgi:hypothetical protein